MNKKGLTAVIALSVIILLSGCNTWRGIPTHGGGKRFDEEQRVVAGAVRRAVADMDVKELSGSNVMVVIDSMAQSGGGTLEFPGISGISGNVTELESETIDKVTNTQVREGWGANASLNAQMSLRPTVFTTEADLKYFEASLGMKLRHDGVAITTSKPGYILYVLVDVLGTNRSRTDSVIVWKDRLNATCEITYYAVEAKKNNLVIPARRASAVAQYQEEGGVGFAAHKITRKIESTVPTPLPINTVDYSSGAPETDEILSQCEPNTCSSETFIAMRKTMEQKVKLADSYVQSGNLDAAQNLINQVRTFDPEFPGLDVVYARLEAALAELNSKNDSIRIRK